jgi:tRNA1(Val) A37 N6-methylase TrmN6
MKPVNEIYTSDGFLNGRVTVAQPARGYRAAIDAVVLAAACLAETGDHILDAGCGVGTAALCAMARTGCRATGIEIQQELAELARANARTNAALGALDIITGSILDPPASLKQRQFDHVICNPPYLPEGYGTGASNPADHESDATLPDWVEFCRRRVRDGGSVVFIHRADRLDELLPLMADSMGAIGILPLWPNNTTEAKRALVGGIKGRKTSMRLLPGLVLHEQDGSYTRQAHAILRDAKPISLWDR